MLIRVFFVGFLTSSILSTSGHPSSEITSRLSEQFYTSFKKLETRFEAVIENDDIISAESHPYEIKTIFYWNLAECESIKREMKKLIKSEILNNSPAFDTISTIQLIKTYVKEDTDVSQLFKNRFITEDVFEEYS